MPALQRTGKDMVEIYHRQVDTVYRVCYSFMKNAPEAEDMVQETFLRLISSGTTFESERHEKAWLIVTASNLCKDSLKRWWRRFESLDERFSGMEAPEALANPVLEAVLALPNDYKTAVYMFYYEGYTTAEIAFYQRCPEATVRSRLSRARKQLKSMLGGDQRRNTKLRKHMTLSNSLKHRRNRFGRILWIVKSLIFEQF